MSINVYGVDDDKEVTYPLRVSPILVPDRHVDLLLFERDGVQHYATIGHFSRLVGRQVSNHGPLLKTLPTIYMLTLARSCWTLMLSTVAMRKDQIPQGPTLSLHRHPETADSTICSIRRLWIDPAPSRWCNGYYTWCCSGWWRRWTNSSVGTLPRAPSMQLCIQGGE